MNKRQEFAVEALKTYGLAAHHTMKKFQVTDNGRTVVVVREWGPGISVLYCDGHIIGPRGGRKEAYSGMLI